MNNDNLFITEALVENSKLTYAGKVNFHVKIATDFVTNEAFKALRTNLLFCANGCKTILVTSCDANDGKSTTTTNIAKSLAEISKKTLLIDADMRNSTFLSSEKMSQISGLSEFLSEQAELSEILYNTQDENYDVIFSGKFPPNPSELLSSPRFKELLNALKDYYDFIIIDTPPIGLVTDAAVIASICDGALLLISTGKTNLRQASWAKKQLEKSRCKLLGAVLNESASKKGYYRKYSRKYKYKNKYN